MPRPMRPVSVYSVAADSRMPGHFLRLPLLVASIFFFHASIAHAALMSDTKQEFDGQHVTQDLRCKPATAGTSATKKDDPANDATKDCMVYGLQPPIGFKMPYKITESTSFSDWNLNAWTPLVDENNHLWSSPYSRGQNNYAQRSAFIGDDPPCNSGNGEECRRMNAAYPQIETETPPETQADKACLNRIKLAQANMQTIMSAALYPVNNEEVKHIAWEEGLAHPAARMSPENHCQTYKKTYDPIAEYQPGCYTETAYRKALLDPTYKIECDAKGGTRPSGPRTVATRDGAQSKTELDEPRLPVKNYQQQPPFTEAKAQQAKNYTNINVGIAGTNTRMGKENVFDVFDPFSPRFDYYSNERDLLSPLGELYSFWDDDNVVCADLPEPASTGNQVKKCGVGPNAKDGRVKVDILSFRWDAFVPKMKRRISLNRDCYNNVDFPSWPCCLPVGPLCIPQECWVCFGFHVGEQVKTPPCSTSYSQEEDLSILPIYIPTKGWRKMPCGESAPSLCEKLRRPYRMNNMLLIRRSECGNPKSRLDVNPDGTCAPRPEGMCHTDYTTCHMPYPIQHDTGAAIHDDDGPAGSQDPMDFAGQYACLVGVGRSNMQASGSSSGGYAHLWKQEDTAADIANSITPIAPAYAATSSGGSGEGSNQKADERCKNIGWGKETECLGMKFNGPDSTKGPTADRATALTEFYSYVATGIRKYNINCVMQQQKAYAPLDSLSKALMACQSAVFDRETCTKKDENGKNVPCTGSGKGEFTSLQRMTYPPAYRGQLCSPKQAEEDKKLPLEKRICAPYFGAKKEPKILTGLDEARPGCIVIMPTGGIGDGKGAGGADSGDKLPLPPSAACIFEVNNKAGAKGNSDCEKNKNCNVIVGAADDGFFPDICLNSSYLGEVQNRTIFKPGMMPESSGKAVESIEQKNKTKEVNRNCERGDLGTCELESWDNAIVYCPNDDLRDAEYYGHP